jgi:hypothetical protein
VQRSQRQGGKSDKEEEDDVEGALESALEAHIAEGLGESQKLGASGGASKGHTSVGRIKDTGSTWGWPENEDSIGLSIAAGSRGK